MENRFRDALEKEQAGSGEDESMDETLSEAGEEMEVGNTPDQDPAERDFTTHELLHNLSGTTGRTQPPHPWDLPAKIRNCPWRVRPLTWG